MGGPYSGATGDPTVGSEVLMAARSRSQSGGTVLAHPTVRIRGHFPSEMSSKGPICSRCHCTGALFRGASLWWSLEMGGHRKSGQRQLPTSWLNEGD